MQPSSIKTGDGGPNNDPETATYQYDALKRLLQANGSNWTENYVYDGYGNLTQMNPSGTANGMPSIQLTMAVDANNVPNNRVTGWADANGNQTGGFAGTSLIYDTANHVSQVQANSQNSYYWYDPDNRRIYYKNASGAETIYFYEAGGKRLATYTYAIVTNTMTGGNPEIQLTQQSTNVYFAGRLVTAEGNLVATDRLASVRSDGSGNLGYQAQYPYGVEYSPTINDREKYATYTRDSVSGLDYAGNRYYWSQWGRFLSPDPYANSAGLGDPGSWNRYAYTRNDPANRLDPTGLQDCQPCLILRPYPLPSPPVDDDTSGNGTGAWGGNSGDGCSEYNPFEKVAGTCNSALKRFGRNPLQSLFLVPAILGAEALLRNNPPCDQLFNTGAPYNYPATVLQNAYDNNQIKLLPFGTDVAPGVGAKTTGVNGLIEIASNRYFVTGMLASGTSITQATSPNFQGLSLLQIDEVIVIHEMLHFVGAVGNDSSGESITLANGVTVVGSVGVSNEIRKDCIRQ